MTVLSRIVVALSVLAGCGPVSPVPRFPYVEDRSLELHAETLTFHVRGDAVEVDACFYFRAHGALRDRRMTFPIPPPRGRAENFHVTLEGPLPSQAIRVERAEPSGLAVGPEMDTYEFTVPGDALAQHHGALCVRYTQPGVGEMAYVLKSGAYWRGPIEPTGNLRMIVE